MRAKVTILLVVLFPSVVAPCAAQLVTVQEVARMEHGPPARDFPSVRAGGVNGIAFSPDGRHLVTQGGDSSVRIWEVPRGREVARFVPYMPQAEGVAVFPFGLAFSPDGRFLVTQNLDATIRVWELASGRVVARMPTRLGRIVPDDVNVFPSGFHYSPDGRYLAAKGHDGLARVWEATSGREVVRIEHEGSARSVLFSPDGRYAAAALDGGIVLVWEVSTGKEVARMKHEERASSVRFSPDGQYLAAAVDPDIVLVWEVSTGKEIARMKHEKSVWTIDWSRDGRYLLTTSIETSGGIVHVWEWATGQEVSRMTHEYGVSEMAISPDGRYLATLLARSAHVWELASGREIARMSHKLSEAGRLHPMRIVFSPDGRYLAGSGCSKTVLVWEATTGREVARLNHKQDVMANIAFSPRGEYLATAVEGKGIISLWSLPPSEGISANLVLPPSPAPKVTADSQPPRNALYPVPPAGRGLVFDEFEMSGVPQAIRSAKTVTVVGELGAVLEPRRGKFGPDATRAKSQVESVIRKWGRFSVVEDPAVADLVLLITEGTYERTSEEVSEVVLMDRLQVFKGAEFFMADSAPLWDSGEIEYADFSPVISLWNPTWMPSIRVAKSLRQFVEALEKDTTK